MLTVIYQDEHYRPIALEKRRARRLPKKGDRLEFNGVLYEVVGLLDAGDNEASIVVQIRTLNHV